jgi:hypothetical protein
MSERKHTLPGGATRSEQAPSYHLIPAAGLHRIAVRYALGAETHGEGNWLLSVSTREDARVFVREAYNHAFKHLIRMNDGIDPEDDHLGAIGWYVCAVAEVERRFGCRWREL